MLPLPILLGGALVLAWIVLSPAGPVGSPQPSQSAPPSQAPPGGSTPTPPAGNDSEPPFVPGF